MVAKISKGKDIIGLVNYNELKVAKGTAKLLHAENMGLGTPVEDMTYSQKIGEFEFLLNGRKGRRLEKTTFHVSLNFDASDKLNDRSLRHIAQQYMERMGYGNQPFLVYRHEDTKHPHVHIVSVNVDWSGNKVDTDLYKLRSEKARKELEVEYGLVRAQGREQKLEAIRRVAPEVVKQGLSEIKSSINNVVMNVVADFAVTSLKEYQDLLQHFNVKAEKVTGTSHKGEHEGLIYSATNDQGKRVGVGIKSSSFYSQPTLNNLMPKFEENKGLKKERAKETAKVIGGILSEYKQITQEEFAIRLPRMGL